MSGTSLSDQRQGVGGGSAAPPSKRAVIGLFLFVIVAWGLSWVVMKIIIHEMTPLWAVASRTWIAAAVLLPAVILTGQLRRPPRADVPVILVIALFHMVGCTTLMTYGLKHVPAGRAIVLCFTTPLWVAPAAWLYLKEPLPLRPILGIGLALPGLGILFDPRAFDWHDADVLCGNALVLGAAICWSVSVLYTRAHRWVASPFQLIVWQIILSATLLTGLAAYSDGVPSFALSVKATWALLYNGAIGTALGFWAMTVVNKTLPATVTSLGILATPVVGLGLSTFMLGEIADTRLVLASLTILAGIALGTVPSRPRSNPAAAVPSKTAC